MKRSLLNLFLILSFNVPLLIAQTGEKGIGEILTNDSYQYISVNEILMWISNNGDGSHDPRTNGGGLYWPGGINGTISAVFEDGLIWGGKIGNEIRANGNTHRHGLQAGKILLDGTPDDPSLTKYRVYKILNGWENLPPGPERDQYEQDYIEWPVADGAPWIDVDDDGIYTPGIDTPDYVGDETLWYVANDMDTSRSTFTYGTLPIGLEFQTTTYAFNETNFLTDVVFKKYEIINKGLVTVEDMYLTYWADDDLGDASDDFSGCDTILNLGYTYNADNYDGGGYGTSPPAVGHMIVQGPIVPGSPSDSAFFNNSWIKGFKNMPMTTSAVYLNSASFPWRDPQQGVPQGAIELYNYMQGLIWDGSPYIDPHTSLQTTFPLSGDPDAGTGWYEGPGWPGGPPPGDRRSLVSSGPFTMAVGDTQEVVVAIFLAQGENNLNSVTKLKEKAVDIQNFYGAYVVTDIDENLSSLPEGFLLFQNYPNPFNPNTTIKFTIPAVETGHAPSVQLIVYDVLGNEIATLVNEEKPAGVYEIEWNADGLPSGVYFYQLKTDGFVETRKMILMK